MKNYNKIIITGITGQDGIFLTQSLLKEGCYKILGTSRSSDHTSFYKKLEYLNLPVKNLENLEIVKTDLKKPNNLNNILSDFLPDYIYNFSGPSSVYDSFKNPEKTKIEIIEIFDNLIEFIKNSNKNIILFQASSSEIFGSMEEGGLHENSLISPKSPYAEAKAEIHNKIEFLRTEIGLQVINGIMFNHESEFRSREYLFTKIIDSAINIKYKNLKNFTIGSLDIERDWSYSGDIMNGVKLLTESKLNEDFVLGSGVSTPIKKIVDIVFESLNLKFEDFVTIDESLLRSEEPLIKFSNPKKIFDAVNWKTTTSVEEILIKNIAYLSNQYN